MVASGVGKVGVHEGLLDAVSTWESLRCSKIREEACTERCPLTVTMVEGHAFLAVLMLLALRVER